ncbi:MAG: type III-A CRISPR-associated protein Cas10/Csm1, partial [Exilispira sp.]
MSNNLRIPDLKEIVTAALLHDIGKFYQRASESGSLERNYEEIYCPMTKSNFYSYKHAGYTAKFFDENRNIFNCFENYQYIRDISAMHHNSTTVFQKIISIADFVSAGIDRIERRTSENPNNFRNIKLNSIFSIINLNNNSHDDNNTIKSYKLRYLSHQNAFPEDINIEGNIYNGLDSYRNLFNEFKKELKNINNSNYIVFESSLIRLLEKYCWCIPSATNDQTRDISLYDHSYTTASIASTLYLYLKEKYDNNWGICERELLSDNIEAINNENNKFARILKVDVSGIQKYIFDIKKATYSSKILRARSFEISFILKAIGQKIKYALGLDQVNILFEGGGNLEIIFPNNDIFINKLKEEINEIEDYIFEKYFGELTFIFSISDPFSLADFNLNEFDKKVRKNIQDKIEIAKLTKLQRILEEKGHVFGKEYETLTKKAEEGFKICPICEKRPVNNYKQSNICDFCSNLIELGKSVTKSDCFVFTRNPSINILLPDIFLSLNENTNFFNNNNFENVLQIYSVKKDFSGLRYSNCYHVPMDNNENILTFEDLGNKAVGNDKIAMLKGDVNNLGAIFAFGLIKSSQNILTLSRYSSLSRMFDYFFTEVLVKMIETKEKKYYIPSYNKKRCDEDSDKSKTNKNIEFTYSDRIYVIYSGGDDFVLVGCWDAIFEFAKDLHSEFKKYSCTNKNINFSCAIEIFNNKT